MFEGSYVALITPMTRDHSVDYAALRKLVRWHISQGTNGIVPAGTTGEAPTLSTEEHHRVIETVVDECNRKVPVIAGCGSNSTAEALDFHRFSHQVGADAALHVTGYYNKPSQEGIYQHFKLLSDENGLPTFVYNVPHRTVIDIAIDTLVRLTALPGVVGVKDATADLTRPILEQKLISQPFSFLSGEDTTAVAYNLHGGHGCISVTANVVPHLCSKMHVACRSGDFSDAMEIQNSLFNLHIALFLEPSPAGIKYACSRLDLCQPSVRPPLTELSDNTQRRIDAALEELKPLM